MQFTQTFVAALLAASSALAAPTSEAKSMMATSLTWTIQNMERTCTGHGQCTWTFSIKPSTAAATACTMVVDGSPASDAPGGPVTCGPFTVTSGWSGQFGAGKGFTTLAVANYNTNLIAYPAYTDVQLVNGKVVTPDQSYTPQTIG